jgi:hypothetical protein
MSTGDGTSPSAWMKSTLSATAKARFSVRTAAMVHAVMAAVDEKETRQPTPMKER